MYRFLLCFYIFLCALACHFPISWTIEIALLQPLNKHQFIDILGNYISDS